MSVFIDNYNNKMACNSFLHLALAPKEKKESDLFPLEVEVINNETKEKIPCLLISMTRLSGGIIPEVIAGVSHNMLPDEVFALFESSYPGVRIEDIAIYHYQKQ